MKQLLLYIVRGCYEPQNQFYMSWLLMVSHIYARGIATTCSSHLIFMCTSNKAKDYVEHENNGAHIKTVKA